MKKLIRLLALGVAAAFGLKWLGKILTPEGMGVAVGHPRSQLSPPSGWNFASGCDAGDARGL